MVSARNGGLAGAAGVQDAAQAEQVGAVVDRLASGLLGGHVLRRAGDDARSAVRLASSAGAGQAEVGRS